MANIETPGLRMHSTALDMDYNRIVRAMYGEYNIRGPFFYPSSPYGTIQANATRTSKGFGRLGDSACGPCPSGQYANPDLHCACMQDCSQLTTNPQALAACLDYNQQSQLAALNVTGTLVQCDPSNPNSTVEVYPGGTNPCPNAPPMGSEAAWEQSQQSQPQTQAQASAQTNQPNQSVPPQNELTPGNTGFTSTAQTLVAQANSTPTDTSTYIPGVSNQTLLLVAAGVAALFLMGGKH